MREGLLSTGPTPSSFLSLSMYICASMEHSISGTRHLEINMLPQVQQLINEQVGTGGAKHSLGYIEIPINFTLDLKTSLNMIYITTC